MYRVEEKWQNKNVIVKFHKAENKEVVKVGKKYDVDEDDEEEQDITEKVNKCLLFFDS